MKTSYELAMERFGKTTPVIKLTAGQKKALAELDSRFAAKIAELEISLQGNIAQAAAAGDAETMEKLQQQLVIERKKLQADLEDKKEQVRQSSAKK